MGTDGLGARVRINRLAADRGRGRRVLFVASIGLLPALAGCSSFSPSSASSNAAGPPNNSSTVAGQSAAPSGYSPAVATATAPSSRPGLYPLGSGRSSRFRPRFCECKRHCFGPAHGRHRAQRPPRRAFQVQSCTPRADGCCAITAEHLCAPGSGHAYCTAVTTEHLCAIDSGRGSRFRSRFCERKRHCFGPTDGRYRAQRPPCFAFQVQFYTACRVGKRAAPAEHLYRLGSALHAASGSACRRGTAAYKFGAVITAPARSRSRATT